MLRALAQSAARIKYKLFFISQVRGHPPATCGRESERAKSHGLAKKISTGAIVTIGLPFV